MACKQAALVCALLGAQVAVAHAQGVAIDHKAVGCIVVGCMFDLSVAAVCMIGICGMELAWALMTGRGTLAEAPVRMPNTPMAYGGT